jgi:hypothetical protein
MKQIRHMMSNAQKFFMHLKNRVQHVYQNLFLISDSDENFITDSGTDTFITDESDY